MFGIFEILSDDLSNFKQILIFIASFLGAEIKLHLLEFGVILVKYCEGRLEGVNCHQTEAE